MSKNYKNSQKIEMFKELFRDDIDSAFKIVSKSPKRLLFDPLSRYEQIIDKNDEVISKTCDIQIKLLIEDFVSYFNNYNSINMHIINNDIDKFIPTFRKKYKYKKKHINRFFRYAKKGLKRLETDKVKNLQDDPAKIRTAIEKYKYILLLKFLTNNTLEAAYGSIIS